MTFFYDMNKKLQQVLETPKSVNQQLNEGAVAEAGYSAKAARAGKDIGKPGKNFGKIAKGAAERYGSKAAGERVAGAVLNKLRGKNEGIEQEGNAFGKAVRAAKSDGIQPGEKVRVGGKEIPVKETGKPMTPKQKSFAKLAPPADKITFADKIAGAKKEVDEMLGDVAAEAMRGAVRGKKQVADEGWDDMLKDVKRRSGQMKTGEKIKGHKGEIEKTATGVRHTRSYDAKTGETDTDGDEKPAGEKRGRGRPKKTDKAPERVTAKAYKHKGGRKSMEEGADEGSDLVKLSKVIQSCTTPEQLKAAQRMAQNFLNKHRAGGFSNMGKDMSRLRDVEGTLKQKSREIGEEDLDEKAVSKKQQKFMGMVHATQKGEKAPSKEVAKVAKTMKKKDAEDFASTKHKGLPEKKKPEGKKREKTEEQGGTDTPTASSGFGFGKGIYDSVNRELEEMIAESMSFNVSSSTEGGKNITITASDDDAVKLAAILKNAGLGGSSSDDGMPGEITSGPEIEVVHGDDHDEPCETCGSADCGCGDVHEALDENNPDWPTDEVEAQDNLEYSGGLNGPKSTGQTVGAPFNRQAARQGAGDIVDGVNEDLARMKALAQKVGGAVKTAAKKGIETLGHGDDEAMVKDLQKKMGVPQTGKKPETGKVAESLRAALEQYKKQ